MNNQGLLNDNMRSALNSTFPFLEDRIGKDIHASLRELYPEALQVGIEGKTMGLVTLLQQYQNDKIGDHSFIQQIVQGVHVDGYEVITYDKLEDILEAERYRALKLNFQDVFSNPAKTHALIKIIGTGNGRNVTRDMLLKGAFLARYRPANTLPTDYSSCSQFKTPSGEDILVLTKSETSI